MCWEGGLEAILSGEWGFCVAGGAILCGRGRGPSAIPWKLVGHVYNNHGANVCFAFGDGGSMNVLKDARLGFVADRHLSESMMMKIFLSVSDF